MRSISWPRETPQYRSHRIQRVDGRGYNRLRSEGYQKCSHIDLHNVQLFVFLVGIHFHFSSGLSAFRGIHRTLQVPKDTVSVISRIFLMADNAASQLVLGLVGEGTFSILTVKVPKWPFAKIS